MRREGGENSTQQELSHPICSQQAQIFLSQEGEDGRLDPSCLRPQVRTRRNAEAGRSVDTGEGERGEGVLLGCRGRRGQTILSSHSESRGRSSTRPDKAQSVSMGGGEHQAREGTDLVEVSSLRLPSLLPTTLPLRCPHLLSSRPPWTPVARLCQLQLPAHSKTVERKEG